MAIQSATFISLKKVVVHARLAPPPPHGHYIYMYALHPQATSRFSMHIRKEGGRWHVSDILPGIDLMRGNEFHFLDYNIPTVILLLIRVFLITGGKIRQSRNQYTSQKATRPAIISIILD